jgi:secreted trypsin-like serine protease
MPMKTSMALGALALAGLFAGPALAEDGAGKGQDRILGGAAASIEEFPWQVALVLDGRDLFTGQFCGGSVIAATWVLTAAHCVWDDEAGALMDPSSFAVYWGSASLEGGGSIVDIRRIVIHEDYTSALDGNDIALLELAGPIGARPIRLATPDIAPQLEAAGTLATVTGWGESHPVYDADAQATGFSGGAEASARFPTDLQSVALPVVNLDKCQAAMSGRNLGQDQICAGLIGQGVDSCQGDSGGPLQVRDGDGRFAQIGVVSFGQVCSVGGYYTVYTRVSAFADWIAAAMATTGETPPAAGEAVVADATFGRIDLAAGFAGDPVWVALAAGGEEDAARLGGACAGYIAGTPDVSLVYKAGPHPLYIAAASDVDTTLVVLDPDGRISCSDDVKGSHPAVEFARPATGTYLVWVGTFERVTGAAWPDATLYISELGARFRR